MFLNTDTIDLFDHVIRLRPGGGAETSTRAAAFTDPGGEDAWTVAAFHFDSDEAVHAHVWERHPAGQEVLWVASGAVNVYLRDGGDPERAVATVAAGESFIVPAGRWHRLSVAEPGSGIGITVRAGTEHEPVAAGPEGVGQ